MSKSIMLNEDNSHYFFTRGDPATMEQDLHHWIEQYADTQIRDMIINVNAMKTNYGSDVWESMWAGFDPSQGEDQPLFASSPPAERKVAFHWVRSAWQLHHAGIDIYAEWIVRSRELGMSPVISLRMNDVHNVQDERNYIHNTLWRTRPDLRRIQHRFLKWSDKAFDYGQQEVRDYHLALVREVVDRYDLDGLELDWMRFGYHFRPGYEDEGALLLTQFIADVRKLLDERGEQLGRRIRLSARVPARPDAALALGMDAVEWARRGLIDQLIITPFWETLDTDMPIELWKQLLADRPVLLAAGLELQLRAHPQSELRQKNSLETVRGAAMSMLSRGADVIYLFNYMDSLTSPDPDYPVILREAGSLDTLRGKARRHVATYADTWAPGMAQATMLPLHGGAGDWRGLRIHIGERPGQETAAVLLAFENVETLDGSDLQVWVNGCLCTFDGGAEPMQPCAERPLFRWIIPHAALKDGYHYIEWCCNRELTAIWAEINLTP